MKKTIHWGLAALFLAITVWTVAPTIAQNVACYMTQGGATWTAGSGCTWTVASGGILDVASGGALKFNAVDKTTALAAAVTTPVAGVAASYRLARGTVTLDGANPSNVSHGLTTVVACTLGNVRSDSPGLDPVAETYVIATGNLAVYAWKHTSAGDPTLIASTDNNDVIAWICIGT